VVSSCERACDALAAAEEALTDTQDPIQKIEGPRLVALQDQRLADQKRKEGNRK
jgi:hypothetical protein